MKKHSGIILAVSGFLALALQANATLVFNLGTVWNGNTPPGTPPWLTAQFADVSAGIVTLTLTPSLTGTSYIDAFTFNIDPNFTPSAVSVSQSFGPTATIHQGAQNAQEHVPGFDGSKGQGWDFYLQWPTHQALALSGTTPATFTLTLPGLTENSFEFLNDTTKGFLTVSADVQGFGGSGAIGDGTHDNIPPVPEPSTIIAGVLLLLPFGASTLRILRRKR